MKRIYWAIPLSLVLLIAIAILIRNFNFFQGGDTDGRTIQTVTAERGTLTETVSAQGTLNLPNQKDLAFGTAGTIDKILVKEGERVRKGQILATLDSASIAKLDKALAQAALNLQNAQDKLSDAKTPYSPVEIAKAQKAVATAQVAINTAEDNLVTALNPYHKVQIAKARSDVATARLALQTTLDTLATTQNPYSNEEIGKAQAQLATYIRTLADDNQSLASTEITWTSKLSTAESEENAAKDKYLTTFQRYFGMRLSEAQTYKSPQTLMTEAQIDLSTIFTEEVLYPFYEFQGPQKSMLKIAGKTSDQVDPVAIYGRIVLMPPNSWDVDTIEEDMDAVWDKLRTARNQLANSNTQSQLAIFKAKNKIATTKDSIRIATEQLEDLNKGSDPLKVTSAQRKFEVALANLTKANEDLDDIEKGSDPATVSLKKQELTLAMANLTKANEDLTEILQGADQINVTLRLAEVTASKAALEEAQDNLAKAKFKAPFDGIIGRVNSEDGKSVAANATVIRIVDPSKVELDASVDEIDIARISTNQPVSFTLDAMPQQGPFVGKVTSIAILGKQQSGVVTYPIIITMVRGDVGASQGQQGNSNRREEMIARFRNADPQTQERMRREAQRQIGGTGSRNQMNGQPQGPRGGQNPTADSQKALPEFRVGMSALANIVVELKENVILVPSRAIKGASQRRYVEVATPSGTEERTVVIGSSDGQRTEVIEGLKEGDVVNMTTVQGVQTDLRMRGFGGSSGGGFGGGPPRGR